MPGVFDAEKYEAEHQVQRAMMETPEAKSAVRDTVRAIKKQQAETKNLVGGRMKKRHK